MPYKKRVKINCLGGEKMTQEKSKFVFVNNTEIPRIVKGRTGKKWKELFAQIPENQSLIITKDIGIEATIRGAVNAVNDELGKVTYRAMRRTVDKKTTIYVTRV